MKTRVVTAMSGGVDSSVAAFLLKEQGYDVIGISLKVWDEQSTSKRSNTCCSFDDIQDARGVCERLQIPFYAFDYQEQFRKKVINTFVDEYERGRTPNPCILCNNHIKFEQLLQEAEKLGATYLATGHHARVSRDAGGIYHLKKGVDAKKDQSYVLHRLGQKSLAKILFPVGEYTKTQIREIACANKIPTASKPESQDICFIPNRDHGAFINKYFPDKNPGQGNFVDGAGQVLGRHEGIHHYTIGQRRGLGIGFGERLYVTRIKPETNEVILGKVADLKCRGLIAREVNWVSLPGTEDVSCGVKIRYQQSEIPSMVRIRDGGASPLVEFMDPHPAVTPGQAVVFYQGDEVLGGGWIERAI